MSDRLNSPPAPRVSGDPIQLLEKLVAIPSLSGHEASAVEFLVATLQSLGLRASIDEAGNAVGIREMPDANGGTSLKIVLLGHIDTVPGAIPVSCADGVLFGRGSVDAKGPLMTMVIAAAQAQLLPGTRVIVVGAVEEESATSRGARHVAEQYRPDYCIIGEPSGWDGITLGYKGRLLVNVDIRRSMGHSAGKQSGVAESAIKWWNRLNDYVQEYNASRPQLFHRLLPTIHRFCTDSDGLVDSAILNVGMRLPPDFDPDSFHDLAQTWLADGIVQCHGYEPAYQASRTSRLARELNRVLRRFEVVPRFKVKTGTSDMNVVGPVWKCPMVAYGPGDSSLDHTPQEHLRLDEYLWAIEVLTRTLESLGPE